MHAGDTRSPPPPARTETDEIAARRQTLTDQIHTLNRAAEILNEVRDFSLSSGAPSAAQQPSSPALRVAAPVRSEPPPMRSAWLQQQPQARPPAETAGLDDGLGVKGGKDQAHGQGGFTAVY